MGSFEKPVPATVPSSPPKPDLNRLHAEVQRLRDAAQTRGHAEGYAAGHAQGLAEGAEAGRAAGHQQGYDEGYQAGHQAGQALAAQEAEQLRALAHGSANALESLHEDLGQAIVALSIKIAEQVLRSTLQAYPDKLLDVVHDILQIEQGKEAALKLRLNPDDLALVRQYLDSEGVGAAWRLVPDSAIERGGCIADTALGSIDASLRTRWHRVVAALGHPATSGSAGA